MTVYRLGRAPVFPDPREAEPGGLIAVGGDLAPERLLAAYRSGIFPWYERPPILWFSPDPRAVLHPGAAHVARRLRRTLRQGRFSFSVDRAFREVIEGCARAPRPEGPGTWITPEMIRAYTRLFELGHAHSVEVWHEGRLAGGIYGVAVGAAFSAESMFHAARDASKAAFAVLAWHLDAFGFELLDCQLPTPHLATQGALAWPRERFLRALARAVELPGRPGRWRLHPELLARHLAVPG